MFSIRKTAATLALAAFVTGGAALATAGAASAAVPADREVQVTAAVVTSPQGGTDPHRIQAASEPDSSMSGTPASTNGTRIWW